MVTSVDDVRTALIDLLDADEAVLVAVAESFVEMGHEVVEAGFRRVGEQRTRMYALAMADAVSHLITAKTYTQ